MSLLGVLVLGNILIAFQSPRNSIIQHQWQKGLQNTSVLLFRNAN